MESHRVHALEPSHAAIERTRFGSDDEVDVIAEEAPGEDLPLKVGNDLIEEIQEQFTVGGIEEEAATRVPGHGDQVDVAFGPEAGSVRHL